MYLKRNNDEKTFIFRVIAYQAKDGTHRFTAQRRIITDFLFISYYSNWKDIELIEQHTLEAAFSLIDDFKALMEDD